MASTKTHPRAPRAGDRLIVRAHRQGDHVRDGEILEVIGHDPAHYRVRWQDDGHETIVYPGPDTFVERL